MNNGNLLNSLLGITSTNPTVSKSTAAKARAESTEKFHQALEQARPEIAARKPAARKEMPAAEPANTARTAHKPLAKQDAQQDVREKVVRSDAQPKTLKDDQRVTAKAGTVDHSVDDKHAHESLEGKPGGEQSSELQDQTLEADQLSMEGQDLILLDDPVVEVNGLIPATSTSAGEVEGVLKSSISVLATAPAQPLAIDESANEDEIDLPLASAEVVVVDPGLMATHSPLKPILTEVDVVTDSEQPLAGLQVGLTNPVVSSGPNLSVDTQATAVQTATVVLAGQVNSAGMDGTDAEVDLLSNTDAETLMDAETGGNPDFALLNPKAALNKLTETAMTAATLDKAAPAADLKPAIISAAAEAMTRLTEAQSPAARAFVVQTGVPVTVGSPQWSQAVGDKVLWLAAQNVSAAEIRLDPPELGPMQVKVSVNQDQASVTFSSPHPAVREALDQQLNRLREMFAEQGLNLVNVDVSDKSFTKREQEESAKHHRGGGEEDEDLAPVAVSQAISMRLVDHYA